MSLPRIAITIGDPAGIGPEIVYKALQDRGIFKLCRPAVIGSLAFAEKLGFDFKRYRCDLYDITGDFTEKLRPGKVTAASGEASYRYILKAVELVKNGAADAIATAPISKEALNAAGHDYSGHTELLAELTKTKDFAMLMAAGKFRAVMVTRHLPVSLISENLTAGEIFKTALLTSEFLKEKAGIKNPRVGVLALNPHAGEAGLLGKEEQLVIGPAVRKLFRKGINASGPLPADSAWQKNKNGAFDLLVAMYHDQAMIGLKILSPENIVNVTLGLPFLRTSPGHGTAFDIAGRNKADPAPMIESIKFAAKYCQ